MGVEEPGGRRTGQRRPGRVSGAGRTAGGQKARGPPLSVTLKPDGPSSRPPLRTPLLVGWHHLVPPHDSCLPPRRLCFNQVSGTPAWTMNQKVSDRVSDQWCCPEHSASLLALCHLDPRVSPSCSGAARGCCGCVPSDPDPAEPGFGNRPIGRGKRTYRGRKSGPLWP